MWKDFSLFLTSDYNTHLLQIKELNSGRGSIYYTLLVGPIEKGYMKTSPEMTAQVEAAIQAAKEKAAAAMQRHKEREEGSQAHEKAGVPTKEVGVNPTTLVVAKSRGRRNNRSGF